MQGFKSVDPYELGLNAPKRIGKEWMLVSSGDGSGWNTMTASWGGMGELWGKPVAFAFVRPSRHTFSFMEKHERFTLSFFPRTMKPALDFCGSRSGRDVDKAREAGLSPFFIEAGGVGFEQADTVIVCEKAYSCAIDPALFAKPELLAQCYPQGDFHTMYVGVVKDCLCR